MLCRNRKRGDLWRPENLHTAARNQRAVRAAVRIVRTVVLAAGTGHRRDLGRQPCRSIIDRSPDEGHGEQKRQKRSDKPSHED